MTYTICPSCGMKHEWSWEDAFDKFGFGDGDGLVMTEVVADSLRGEGYDVEVQPWGMHDVVITAVSRDSVPLIPATACIGYDDPRLYLPPDLVALLDREFSTDREV